MRRTRQSFKTCVVLMVMIVGLSAAMPLAGAAKPGDNGGPGNSGAAKQCQEGGWEELQRADDTTFANKGECVSYAAEGGKLEPLAIAPCLGEGWTLVAPSEAPGAAFQSLDECTSYVSIGGLLVDQGEGFTYLPFYRVTPVYDPYDPYCTVTGYFTVYGFSHVLITWDRSGGPVDVPSVDGSRVSDTAFLKLSPGENAVAVTVTGVWLDPNGNWHTAQELHNETESLYCPTL